MGRLNEFSNYTKLRAIIRQCGVCAFCGVTIRTPWSGGFIRGKPIICNPSPTWAATRLITASIFARPITS